MNTRGTPTKTFIYAMSDPRTGETRYVGATINPVKRKKTHFSSGHKTTRKWVRMLKSLGLQPIFQVVDVAYGYHWIFAERHYVGRCVAKGHRVLNRCLTEPYDEAEALVKDESTNLIKPSRFTPRRIRFDLHGVRAEAIR
jgi:hypothetical protein